MSLGLIWNEEVGVILSKYMDAVDYIDRRVKIKYTNKVVYQHAGIIGKSGTVAKTSGNSIGVLIDGKHNKASNYGIYWFDRSEIKIITNESEDIIMENFKNVAIVNLLDDYNKKDYAFALYDEDFKVLDSINNHPAMVVVNASSKNNRLLGKVKSIMSVEEFYSIDKNKHIKITAEVVGVVNMDGYIAREDEKIRLAELEKKKAAIEKVLEEEINKRKSVEYYETMAQKYSDNPRLAELVAELKSLGD
jgi:hypothetical protein